VVAPPRAAAERHVGRRRDEPAVLELHPVAIEFVVDLTGNRQVASPGPRRRRSWRRRDVGLPAACVLAEVAERPLEAVLAAPAPGEADAAHLEEIRITRKIDVLPVN